MRKYIITLLTMILFVMLGVNHAGSQMNLLKEKNKSMDKNKIVEYNKLKFEESKPELTEIKIENDNYILMKASAYTKSIEEGTHKGITKSGIPVSRGIVSVDPKTIPLGTRLYIEGYGHALAADTGGAIKDNRIDLYMDNKDEAFEFGRKDVRVWILQEGE